MTKRLPDNGHVHPEYWTERDHERFEDKLVDKLSELRKDVNLLTQRMTLLIGGVAVGVFVMNLIGPWLGNLLGIVPK